MSYIESNKIKVFPYGQTRESDSRGRVLNEHNIAKIIRSLSDKDGYVISYENSVIDFVLHGYIISADIGTSSDVGTSGPLWAGLDTDPVEEGTGYTELSGGDTQEGKFEGVAFVKSEDELTGYDYVLQLLDENNTVPQDSYIRYSSKTVESLSANFINCGSPADFE